MKLHIQPGVIKDWEKFKEDSPGNSMALDTYVLDEPQFERGGKGKKGPFLNVDHHVGPRFALGSTCLQLKTLITSSLFDTFKNTFPDHLQSLNRDGNNPKILVDALFDYNDEKTVNVYINDPDEDTTLSVFLIGFYDFFIRFDKKSKKRIDELVRIENELDMKGGFCNMDKKSRTNKKVARIFEPFIKAKLEGKIVGMGIDEMKSLLREMLIRLCDYTMGKAIEINIDTTYEIMGGGDDRVMIKEIGPYARTQLFKNKIKIFISRRSTQIQGRNSYTIGKSSPFVDIDLFELYEILNQIEGLTESSDRWGGSETMGGSPKKYGSKLSQDEVSEIMNDYMYMKKDLFYQKYNINSPITTEKI